MAAAWWINAAGPELAQGDLLPDTQLPVFTGVTTDGELHEEIVRRARLIVITQSCDLAQGKAEFVALCPVHTLAEFEAANPRMAKQGQWEQVRKGRVEALHLLASPDRPDENRAAFVVDFGMIVSVPLAYLFEHAQGLGQRWRLVSPFLEHFSQALARFFMRVGLPTAIPPYK